MKKFKVNDKEFEMVDKIEEITLYQYQVTEYLIQNLGKLVDSQILQNIIEVLSGQELNTLGDMESEVMNELTDAFTKLDYSNLEKFKNDKNHLVIDGVDYAIKTNGDFNTFKSAEKIYIDIMRRDMLKYLKGGKDWKKYYDLIMDGAVGKITMDEFNKEMEEFDMDDFNKFLIAKLNSEIDINFTILSIMIQPGTSKFDEERKEEVWIQKEFSTQNLNVRKDILRKNLKALDGIKPLSFFLNGNSGSQIDSQNSKEEKPKQNQEEVLLNQ